MKIEIFVVLFALCQGYSHHQSGLVVLNRQLSDLEIATFKSWTQKFNKTYSDYDEEYRSMTSFGENLRMVTEHNQKKASWKMSLNKFSDVTFDEFRSMHLMQAQNCSATKGNHLMTNRNVPSFKDWREEGNYVTPVKNQGGCGSCWTFSTTGCLESATAIHKPGNPLFSLSEQQLVDCAQNFNNHGCNGGLPSQAFEYIKYNNGLMNESSYPYTAKDGKCKFVPSEATAFVKGVVNITEGAENEIVDAVAFKNPVSIAFEVTKDFTAYTSGIYTNKNCGTRPDQVNHAVLVVGYGSDTETGMDYWIIKNSWGADWGIKGYFMMERGVNMCGIATCPSYPIV